MSATARGFGKQLMPWQEFGNDVAYEVDPDTGLLVYGTVILTTPRQQGKTLEVVTVMTHRCVAWPRQNVAYSAQTFDAAGEKWRYDHLPMLADSVYADRFEAILQRAAEKFVFDNGSTWGIQSTTKKAGHGPTLDLGVADESWAHQDNRLDQAWLPAMLTRDNSQMWVPSTAGPSAEESPYLWEKVEKGRAAVEAGEQSGICHIEYGARPGQDPDDPATWWECMPALGYTITEQKVRDLKAAMPTGEWERAGLNRWGDEKASPSFIDLERWLGCADPRSRHGSPIALAIAASIDHEWCTIAMYGPRSDGRGHAEVIAHRARTDWVVEEVARLLAHWSVIGIGLDLGGPAGHLHLALSRIPNVKIFKSGMKLAEGRRHLLTVPTVREAAQAAGSMYEAIMADQVRWLGPTLQAPLQKAVAGAKTRPLGDAWAWARKGNAEISPLDAITLARWVYEVRSPAYDQGDYDLSQSVY